MIENDTLHMTNKIAVVLLSGGLDSCVASTMKAKECGTQVYLLSVDYESAPSLKEEKSRTRIAHFLMDKFHNVKMFEKVQLKGYMRLRTLEKRGLLPQGYPFTRDESFMLLAASWLERLLMDSEGYNEGEVVIGTTREDTLNFEDIRPEIYTHINAILSMKYCTKWGKEMKVDLPLLGFMKHEIVKKGIEMGAPLEYTWSCYFGEEAPCASCDQCGWRKEAFEKAKVKDPILLGS